MHYWVFVILLIVMLPFVLLLILKPVYNDKKARGKVINFDSFLKNYSFVLDCSQNDAVYLLSKKNAKDTLNYTFRQSSMIIRFEYLNASIEYQLSFYIIDNKTYLEASQLHFMVEKSNIPFMINRFFIEKIGATPIDYHYFKSIVKLNNI